MDRFIWFQEAEKALEYFRNASDNPAQLEAINAELQLFKNVIEEKKKTDEQLTVYDFSKLRIMVSFPFTFKVSIG